jgi:hypothetical protein
VTVDPGKESFWSFERLGPCPDESGASFKIASGEGLKGIGGREGRADVGEGEVHAEEDTAPGAKSFGAGEGSRTQDWIESERGVPKNQRSQRFLEYLCIVLQNVIEMLIVTKNVTSLKY